jgi:hypothetical protein
LSLNWSLMMQLQLARSCFPSHVQPGRFWQRSINVSFRRKALRAGSSSSSTNSSVALTEMSLPISAKQTLTRRDVNKKKQNERWFTADIAAVNSDAWMTELTDQFRFMFMNLSGCQQNQTSGTVDKPVIRCFVFFLLPKLPQDYLEFWKIGCTDWLDFI